MAIHLFENELGFADVLASPLMAWQSPLRQPPVRQSPVRQSPLHAPVETPPSPAQNSPADSPADSLADSPAIATATNIDQPDLYYLESVFATAGYTIDPERGVPVGWNHNDDFMLPGDVWMARTTPEDKPLNLNHNCADIIGHITDVFAEDLQGNLIEADASTIPESFNLVTRGVLYRVWWTGKAHDEKREALVAGIISELPDKWCVSMECLFYHFDYALLDEATGSVTVVERTKANSDMTKSLRIVGGKGVYDGRRIARVPRKMVFSGKGIVANPANPKSIIRAETQIIEENQINTQNVYEIVTQANSETNMTEKEIEALKAELAAAKTALADAHSKNKEADQKQIAELTAALAAEKAAKASLEDAVKAANEQAKASVEKLVTEKNEVTATLAKAQAELAEIKQQKVQTDRASKVVDSLKVERAQADSLVKTLAGLSDEQFDAHVALLAQSVTLTSAPVPGGAVTNNPQGSGGTSAKPAPRQPQTGVGTRPKKTSLPAHQAFASEEGGDDEGDEAALDEVSPVSEPALATAAEIEAKSDTVRAVFSKIFGKAQS